MRSGAFRILLVVTVVMLVGPAAAWAQEDGTAGDPTSTAAGVPVTTQQETVTTTTESDDTSTPPADEVAVPESTPSATDGSSAESTEAPVPEAEAADTAVPAPSQARVEAQPQAQLETGSQATERWGAPAKAKKAARSAKASGKAVSCARMAAGPIARAAQGGPPAAGCTRIDGGQVNGVHVVVVNGVPITFTFTVTNTPNGPVLTWTSDVPFTGTIFVKGGPAFPGFPCVYANATADASGNCHPPVNPNNGKFYGVSHIDICPGGVVPPPITTPGGGPGGAPGGAPGGQGGTGGQQQGGKKGVAGEQQRGGSPFVASVAASTAAAPGEQLPFTGMNSLWLLLLGGTLLGSGAVLRVRRD